MPQTMYRRSLLQFLGIVLTLAGLLAVPRAQGVSTPTPTDRFLTVNGLRIHYVDWGGADKPALVLIHGVDRVARTFDHLAPHFAGRYHVIAVDMRGHGDSGWDAEARYLVEDHLSDLEGLVAQLGLRNIVVWGNSTGGRVAQVFAGAHPELVTHVVSEDVGPERPRQISDGYARRAKTEDAGWATEAELLAQLGKLYPNAADGLMANYVRHGTRRTDSGRIAWKRDPRISNGFVPTDLWRFIRQIKAPILYLLGGNSRIVPAATQAEIRQALPQARIVTMPGLGHYPSDEKPQEFLQIVDTFLAGRLP